MLKVAMACTVMLGSLFAFGAQSADAHGYKGYKSYGSHYGHSHKHWKSERRYKAFKYFKYRYALKRHKHRHADHYRGRHYH